jgi:hypothetical protein
LTIESFHTRDLGEQSRVGNIVEKFGIVLLGMVDETIGGWANNTEDLVIILLRVDADLLRVEILHVVI